MQASQVAAQVEQLASAYAALGLQPKDRIGVLGQNAQEWMMAMQVWKVWEQEG